MRTVENYDTFKDIKFSLEEKAKHSIKGREQK